MSAMATSETKLRFLLSPSVIEAELTRRRAAFVTLFPASGPLGREFYQKHLEFFAAGAKYKERCSWPPTGSAKPSLGRLKPPVT
jgi:hypothetical protein